MLSLFPLVVRPETGHKSRYLEIADAMASSVEMLGDRKAFHVEPDRSQMLCRPVSQASIGLPHVDHRCISGEARVSGRDSC